MGIYDIQTVGLSLFFCAVMFIIGTCGNILIIWTISRTKALRTIQNIFVACLAITDFLIILYLIPFNIVYILIQNAIPDRELCRFNAVITAFLFTCSIQFIMHIAVCRYVKICHPQRFSNMYTKRCVAIAISASLTLAIAFASSMWFYDHLWTFDKSLHSCIFDRYGDASFSYTYMIISLLIPINVTSYCYVKIYIHVSNSKKSVHRHWNNGLARRKLMHELMVTRTQFSVFIAYLILYIPFGITSIFGNKISDFPEEFHALAIYMCFANSCINSVLYGVINRNMRKAYKDALCGNKSLITPINTGTISVIETGTTTLESTI